MTTAAERQPKNPTWETTTRRLRAFVARRVPVDDVDDITQDILLRILRSGRSVDSVEATPSWLYTVARNAVIDHYRTRRIHDSLPSEFERRFLEDGIEQPHEALQDAARCLRPAVAILPEPYREAITRVDLDGMTHAAAARAVGISTPGMKSRVQRGRRQLAHVLANWCRVYLGEDGRVASDPCACDCAAC
jgi:RNA polymerase sigma-70 factor (ECF subfamily)